ncbi:hypothetical protein J7M23_06580 [Candidatus Sumerlaeota bacterium]|nr:hypothetical protein [Candidatus Sumerlaeota bacterium]
MNVNHLLSEANISEDEPVLLITAKEALENLDEAVQEYCPNLRLEQLEPADLRKLLFSYAQNIILFHPEDSHQERATLLENFEMLKQYGLNDEDYGTLDFT